MITVTHVRGDWSWKFFFGEHAIWCCLLLHLIYLAVSHSVKWGKYPFCFPPLIFSKLLNVTLGDVYVVERNGEDNNMDRFSVSYKSLGQYKICY